MPPPPPPPPPEFDGLPLGASLAIAAILVALSGLFSGLNLGLMSLTEEDLNVVIRGSDSPKDVVNAKKILPLRKRGNLLLCSLLLGNTAVNALVAILLADVASGVVGLIATTGLLVIFGEIVPQSLCSRYALSIGAKSIPLVWFFVVMTFPIACPIAMILDKLLGSEVNNVFKKKELLEIIKINLRDAAHADKTDLTLQDAKVLTGALSYGDLTVDDVMTPLSMLYALPEAAVLDDTTILSILSHGFTRIPVYTGGRDHLVALLFCKDLLGMGYERSLPLTDVLKTFDAARRIHYVRSDVPLSKVMREFKKARCMMLCVVAPPPSDAPATSAHDSTGRSAAVGQSVVGVITMEDVVEEILMEEIIDETDVYLDNTRYTTIDARAGEMEQPARPSLPAPLDYSARATEWDQSGRATEVLRSEKSKAEIRAENRNLKRYDTSALMQEMQKAKEFLAKEARAAEHFVEAEAKKAESFIEDQIHHRSD